MKKFLLFILQYFNDFLNLLFPEFCVSCNANLVTHEYVICTRCLYHLPRTNFHKVPGNPVEESFWGRQSIERASSYFFFQKESKYQQLLHQLKYRNRPDVGIEMGRHFGSELVREPAFNEVDLIVPVPLHKKKLRKRGYNQSEKIAEGLAQLLQGELNTTVLLRTTFTDTQTKKGRFDRWENVKDVFECKNPEFIEGKHILLVDDVMTTGATLEGCIQVLHEAAKVKISVATLAYAKI